MSDTESGYELRGFLKSFDCFLVGMGFGSGVRRGGSLDLPVDLFSDVSLVSCICCWFWPQMRVPDMSYMLLSEMLCFLRVLRSCLHYIRVRTRVGFVPRYEFQEL